MRVVKAPDGWHVMTPEAPKPALHVTMTDWPVVPEMEFVAALSLLATCVDAHALAAQVGVENSGAVHTAGPEPE